MRISLRLIALIFGIATICGQPLQSAIAGVPVMNSTGVQRFMVLLNESAVSAESEEGEAAATDTRDQANRSDFRLWHKPKLRKFVKKLEREYSIQAVAMTSHAASSFSAYIPTNAVDRLRLDPRISEIVALHENVALFSTYYDVFEGAERVPWGKIAIGTNDTITTNNLVYMIDGGAQLHNELNLAFATVNPCCSRVFPDHANHVAGILGARRDAVGVRGINPDALVMSVNRGNYADEFAAAMDWVLADAESRYIFAVANLSSNFSRFTYPTEYETLQRYIARMSNRVLVVESAGNKRENACDWAFSDTRQNDGILVVGAFDQDEKQAIPIDNTGIGWQWEPGSNFGPCVEVWGPGKNIWSTFATSPSANQVLSGTSMAAPHVAGLAARFGTTATTPVLRENFIRSTVFSSLSKDDAGLTISIPYWRAPGWTMPTQLPVYTVTAGSTMAGTGPAKVVDGYYTITGWNAGHGAPAWIEFDLGTTRNLWGIRLTPEVSPEGPATHQIWVGDTPNPTTLVGRISTTARNMVPQTAALGNAPDRYVRVVTLDSPSWVAWTEIELYGY
jgi:subtilisin family serine protease